MSKKVLVILTTYNGEKYLRDQLDSIYSQSDVDVSVFTNDDGSSDSTLQILKEYQNNRSLMISNHQDKHGFTYNFIDAIFANKDTDYDYYALADQDDYWKQDKLISAIRMLETSKKDVYSSNLTIVDQDLNGDVLMNDNSYRKCNKYNAVFENIATGCTIVFTRKFLNLLTKYYPENIYLHDYWIYLVSLYTDSYIYDDRSFILYRQHGNNQIGEATGQNVRTYYKKFKSSKSHQSVLCQQLLKGYGDEIGIDNVNIITPMAEYKRKLKYRFRLMFSRKYRKRNHNFFKFIKLALNKY